MLSISGHFGKFIAQWLAGDGRIRSINIACDGYYPASALAVYPFVYNDTLYAMICRPEGFTIWEVSDGHIVHRFGCHCEFPAAYYISVNGLSSGDCVYVGSNYEYIVKFRNGLVRRVKRRERRYVGVKLNAIPSRFGEEVSLSTISTITVYGMLLHRHKFRIVMSIWDDMWLVMDDNGLIMGQYCMRRRQIVWTMGFGTTGIGSAQYLSESVIQCITKNGTMTIVNTVDESRYYIKYADGEK